MEKEPLLVVLLIFVSFVVAKLPEEDMTVPEIIKYWGYPNETHEVKTADGYYLTLHRIPHGRNDVDRNVQRRVVFLQHGLISCSSDWVLNFPDDSLAFMLADAGFDVWLGNARGNTYSKKHETLSVHSAAFWDFSFHEMAKYDLPAMIDYVLQSTREEDLYYVGHSQGTMMIFAGLPGKKQLQKSIKTVFALAPVTRLKNIYSPIKYLALFETFFKDVIERIYPIHEILSSSKAVKILADILCGISKRFCETILSLIAGYDTKDLNKTRIPIYYSHTPAGTSVKNMYHFGQLIKSKVFQLYDYGYLGNLKRYNSLHPPIYHFESIETPIVMFGGSNDWLAAPADVSWTAKQLRNLVSLKTIEGYNHLDFIWGLSAKTKVYKKIIDMII